MKHVAGYFKLSPILMLLVSLQLLHVTAILADDPPAPPAMGARVETPEYQEHRGKDLNNLTDRDKWHMDNYVHQGYLQREVDEACKGMEDACQGREAREKFMGMDPGMVKALSKMYAMFVGTGGGKLETKDGKGTTDKCKYIPAATEMVAMGTQQSKQQQIQNAPIQPGSEQKERLYQAARSHEARADTAKLQTYGWGGTTACYAAMIPMAGVKPDTSYMVKMGAAGVLTLFYKQQWDAHQEYHDKVMAIADKLSGKGTCNPVSENQCFCAQPETTNDAEYCLPSAAARARAKYGKVLMNCLDRNLKRDEACNCLATDSCYDAEFMQLFGGAGGGGSIAPYTIKPIKDLSRGSLGTGGLSGANARGQGARARRILKDLDGKIPFNRSLTPSQQKVAKELAKRFGAPAALAAHVASMPASAASKNAMAKMRAAAAKPSQAAMGGARGGDGNMLYFGGKGLKKRKKRARGGFDYKKLMKKKRRGRGSGKVLSFAEKARRRASIHRNSDTPLFEIISHRYKMSARRLLGIGYKQ